MRFAQRTRMRWRRVADSIVLALAAYLQASFLANGVGALLSRPALPTAPPVRFELASPERVPGEVAAAFLRRNPFSSASGRDNDCPVLSVSIISQSADMELSLASLRDGPLIRVGSRVGELRVVEIGERTVSLSDGTVTCRATFEPAPAGPAAEGEIAVERPLRDQVLANPRRLLQGARIEPEYDGGRISAIRIRELVPGALLERLGLRPGDRVRSLNGMTSLDPSASIRAWTELSRAESFRIAIERDGRQQELVVRMR